MADHLVIIELKQSNIASRQAIHEILKYVEAVKYHLAVRDDEIRTMIVSTEWTELLLPFSRFCSDTSLDVTGYLLDISDPSKLTSRTVSPLQITAGRAFSPWHELNLYTERDQLQRGVETYEHANRRMELDDYVLVVLEPPPGHYETALSATHDALADVRRMFNAEVDYDEIEESVEALPEYKHMLYFVPCLLPKEACIDALRRADEDTDDVIEDTEQMEEKEALCVLHEALFDAMPTPFREHFETGNAAKFKTKLLEDEGWVIVEIKRYGSIKRNPLLTDETIVSEICGATGSSGQHYERRISTAVKSELAVARSEIAECLSDNPAWRANVLAHLQEIEDDFPSSELDIRIFSPSTGLFTLYFALTYEHGEHYVPSYHIKFQHEGDAASIFFGQLETKETEATFREVLDNFYDGDARRLAVSAAWGFREPRDAELLGFLGITYCSYRCDLQGSERRLHVWRDSAWHEIEPVNSLRPLASFFQREQTFMHHLVTKLGRRIRHGFVDSNDTELPLRGLAEHSTLDSPLHEASDLPSHCNLCDCAFAEENFLVEASLPDFGDVTASLCADCVADTATVVGQNEGQLYRRVDSGGWESVSFGKADATSA